MRRRLPRMPVICENHNSSGKMENDDWGIELFPDVRVHTLNRIFNASNLKERVQSYTDGIYQNSHENRKIRKAFKNALYDILKKETEIVKNNIRVIELKPPLPKRKKRQYKPTPYVQFCREMRQKHDPKELVGKIQTLWREHKVPVKPVLIGSSTGDYWYTPKTDAEWDAIPIYEYPPSSDDESSEHDSEPPSVAPTPTQTELPHVDDDDASEHESSCVP